MNTLAALLVSQNIHKKKQPLFVKDGDDIVIQKSISSSPGDGIRTSVYKHFASKMRVVVCRTSSPIYNLNIYVPTVAPNNKGLPHTLEHLVFCGSKRHPTRGYIDVLAAYNYSIGTNAWTTATYANDSGGKTRDIATLTNKEIIDYHYKYYDANNITVVLTGAFSDDFEEKYLQTIPSDIVKSYGCNSRAPMDCSPPGDGSPRHETVRFPSSDTSSGSFRFGWQGPKHGDVETRIALEIMMEYLAGTSSSPLNLRFVERPAPLASSLCTEVDDYIVSMLSVSLLGVPYTDQEGSQGNGDAMADQDIPHLYEEGYFKNLLLNELDQIYKTRFNGDAHALENAAKRRSDEMALSFENNPDEALQVTLRSDIVASHFSPESQGKFRIGLRAKQFDIAVKLSQMPVEYWLNLLKKWFIDGTVYSVAMVPDLELGPKLEAELPDRAIGPVTAVQTINADSGFVEAQIQIPIGDIPEELRAYLVLFQDVLLDTNLVLPAGVVYDNDKESLKNEKRIQYSEFASKMADLVTSRNACISSDSILLTVGPHFTDVLPGNDHLSNKRHMSFLAQEAVLTNIIEKAKSGKVDEVIAKLKDIQNILVQATGGFMALSLPSRENSKPYIDAFENEWKMCYDQYLDDIPFHPTGKRSFNDELTDLISLDYFALKMLALLMSRMDGPLDNAVRSRGYSYGASAFIGEWPKVFSLWIYQASDIVKAIGAINRLFVDMLKDWGSFISDHDINLARSVAKYQSVADQSTPKMVLEQSISNSINGFSSTEQYNTWCNTHIAAVKMSDLRRVFKKYMLNFVDSHWPMLRLVVTTLGTEMPARLGPYEKKTLKEISATYKTDY
ncbi:hypothetical protein GGI11_004489 [Coemansia sp. RSA 2049]|nr:hypothetical protein GGI11_004489 [Coemansia sp. RSA 2049]